jgi:hypothetical protein
LVAGVSAANSAPLFLPRGDRGRHLAGVKIALCNSVICCSAEAVSGRARG